MTHEEIMKLGAEEAEYTMNRNIGGPFGAVVMKDGKIVAIASNSVLQDHDPTAHAEVNAIRLAAQNLGTHDLSGCELYATSEPCPMCLAAIIWSNIKKVYYGCTAKDAADIGFRDDYIYEFIQSGRTNSNVLDMENIGREECLKLFDSYKKNQGQMY